MGELRELLQEVWSQRRRLLPVVIGLAFGTAGLAVLLAFGDGFAVACRDALHRSGDAMLRWSAGTTSRPFAGQPAGRSVPVTAREAELLLAAPDVVATSPEAQFGARMVTADGRFANVAVAAVGSEWAAIRGLAVQPGGRFLSAADAAARRRTVVLGPALAAQLFPRGQAVGAEVRLLETPFTVVGVLADAALFMNYGSDLRWRAIVPWPTGQTMRGLQRAQYVLARVRDPEDWRTAEQRQRDLLAARLHFDPGDEDALHLSDHARQASEIRAIFTGTRWFLLVVGLLGLLVAAIGVANATFVMVEERVPEIGLRLALGATPRQIRWHSLLATAAIVGIGGGSGLLAAALLLVGVDCLPLPAEAKGYLGQPLLSVSAALAIAGLLGLCAGVAGWQPAARAAAVQPVEALRHD